jgi:ABC-2 type transport system ATP-binding protein
MTDAIRVQNLVKRYGALTAVDGLSFSVSSGDVFGILGPNGAGKTTTLEIIEGLQQPTEGTTHVLNMDSYRDSTQVRERIGVQLQASAYFNYLKLREILELFGRFYTKRLNHMELLETVGLAEKADVTVDKLSGGQKQRFTIAAALINDPQVVFLDEPTSGLDPQARRSLWGFIDQIRGEGRTIVLTTHYMEEAELLCDQVAIMDHGKIVVKDSPKNLIRRLEMPYEIKFKVENVAEIEGLQELSGVREVEAKGEGIYSMRSSDASRSVTELLALMNSQELSLTDLEVLPGNLEDVFLSLTGHRLRD